MLSENIKTIRKSKGLSQQELAVKLNVVRQTVSKWEQGLSVPDSDLLIALSEALETPVSTLLGENVAEADADTVKVLSEKLEIINLEFARRAAMRRAFLHWSLIALCAVIVVISAALVVVNSPYLSWDFRDPEIAVVGTVFHDIRHKRVHGIGFGNQNAIFSFTHLFLRSADSFFPNAVPDFCSPYCITTRRLFQPFLIKCRIIVSFRGKYVSTLDSARFV